MTLALDKSIWWPDVKHVPQLQRPAHPPVSVLYDAPQGAALGTVQSARRNMRGTGHKGWCIPLPFSAALEQGPRGGPVPA